MLTLEKLKELNPGIFSYGDAWVEGYWDASKQMHIDFVAVRGTIHDWAIYYQLHDKSWNNIDIKNQGEKMRNEDSIKKCVPCDEEAFKMYRF